MSEERIILPISPQTHIRSNQGDKILFRIPETCKRLKGRKPCAKFRKTGQCKHILSEGGLRRKRRLEKYNKYKVDLRELAIKNNFVMPVAGWSVYFYFPIPASWTLAKRKKFHGQLKLSKSDIDNILKAFFDSLSITDETVGQLSGVGKFWVDTMTFDEKGNKQVAPGWIEILLNQTPYNPFGINFINQDDEKAKPKRKWISRKPGDPLKRKPKPIALDKRFLKEDKIK